MVRAGVIPHPLESPEVGRVRSNRTPKGCCAGVRLRVHRTLEAEIKSIYLESGIVFLVGRIYKKGTQNRRSKRSSGG
jgi:hypothetical protein